MSALQPLQFYFMHFMPYPHIAPGRPQGQWVDIQNQRFDPKTGHKLYKEYIDELVLADKLGYDGLVVNEHHSTFYSLMPSCSVIAGALAMLTERAKICVFGTPIALTYPHRLAEEYHVGWPARMRVSAWDRHGILGQSDQSELFA